MTQRLRVEVARTLDRPVDIVFGALSDERESHHWRPISAAGYDVGGPCVIGAKFWRSARGKRRAFEVTSCQPHALYATASADGSVVELLSCHPLDRLATEVELVVEQRVRRYPAPLRWLASRALRRRLERQLAAASEWLAPASAADRGAG